MSIFPLPQDSNSLMILSLEWVVIKKRTDRQLSYIYSYFILSRLWKIAVVIAIVSEYVLDRIFSIFKWEFIHFSQNNQEIHIFFTFPYSIIRSWHHLYTSKSPSTFLTLHVCWVVVFKPTLCDWRFRVGFIFNEAYETSGIQSHNRLLPFCYIDSQVT